MVFYKRKTGEMCEVHIFLPVKILYAGLIMWKINKRMMHGKQIKNITKRRKQDAGFR